jgi:hypothetical protein
VRGLVEEIRGQKRQLVMKSSYAALARVVGESKEGTPQGEVLSLGLDWLPDKTASGHWRLAVPIHHPGR